MPAQHSSEEHRDGHMEGGLQESLDALERVVRSPD
jgi:hypothetical protein